MLLTADELPVDVAVLDQQDGAIARLDATLHLLHDDRAVLSMSARGVDAYLRWGTRVRFWMADGPHGYEVTGAVVAHDAPTGDNPRQRVVLRLWECRPRTQQRALPRCRARFPVYLRSGETASENPAEEGWQEGWSVDLGAGGMRLRTHCHRRWSRRVELRFTLPHPDKTGGGVQTPCHEFCLTARVLRLTLPQAQTRPLELAVSFEKLSLEDGLMLAAFLHGD